MVCLRCKTKISAFSDYTHIRDIQWTVLVRFTSSESRMKYWRSPLVASGADLSVLRLCANSVLSFMFGSLVRAKMAPSANYDPVSIHRPVPCFTDSIIWTWYLTRNNTYTFVIRFSASANLDLIDFSVILPSEYQPIIRRCVPPRFSP